MGNNKIRPKAYELISTMESMADSNGNGIDSLQEQQKLNSAIMDALSNGILKAKDVNAYKAQPGCPLNTVFTTDPMKKQQAGGDAFVATETGNTPGGVTEQGTTNTVSGITQADYYTYNGIENRRKNDVKKFISDAANDNMQTLSTLKVTLSDKFEAPVFKTYTTAFDDIVTAMGNYSSKKDIEALDTTVRKYFKDNKKTMTAFHKSILADMIKLARKDQIVKEAGEFIDIYEREKSNEQNEINYTKYVNNAMTQINQQNLFGGDTSYQNEAMYIFQQHVNEDAYQLLIQEVAQSTKTTSQDIKSELKNKYKDDKVMLRLIDEKEGIFNRKSMGNTFNQRKGELATITVKEMEKGLGRKLTGIVFDYYLHKHKNEDKSYDMSALSDTAEYRAGADLTVNISIDNLYSELENIKKDLSADENLTLTDGELKKILDFIKLEHAKREKLTFSESVDKEDWAKDASSGALANLPGIHYVSQQVVISAVNADEFNTLTSVLKNSRIPFTADSSKSLINISQTVFDGIIGPALGGAAVSILANLLWKMIIGEMPDEQACANIVDNLDKALQYKNNPDGFKQELSKYTKNESVAKKIGQLVDLYVDKNTNTFNVIDFLDFANKSAGPGSKWNCSEIGGALLKAREEITENPNGQDASGRIIIYGNNKISHPESQQQTRVVVQGKTWVGHTYEYPCLRDLFDNTPIKKNGVLLDTDTKAARALKIIQAIKPEKLDEYINDKSKIAQLVKKSYENPQSMKDEEDIDYATYTQVLSCINIGMIYLPNELFGCERNTNKYAKQNYKSIDGTRFNAATRYTKPVEIVDKDGKGLVKVDGKLVDQTFNSLDEAQQYANDFKSKNEKYKDVDIVIAETEEKFNNSK